MAIGMGRAGGMNLIAVGATGTVHVWDSSLRGEMAELAGYRAWSPIIIGQLSGQDVIAFGGRDGKLRIWDVRSMRDIPILARYEEGVTAVAIGQINNREMVVTGGEDCIIRLWWPDGRTEQVDFSSPGPRRPFSSNVVSAIAVGSIEGRDVIAAGCEDGKVHIWDPIRRYELAMLPAHDRFIKAVRIQHIEGRDLIVTAGQQDVPAVQSIAGSVRLWDLAQTPVRPEVLLDIPEPHGTRPANAVTSMTIGRMKGRDVVVCSCDDGTVRIRSLGGPPEPEASWGQHSAVTALAIGALGGREVIVSGSGDGSLRILDPVGNAEPVILAGHERPAYSVAIGQIEGEDVVVSGGDDMTLRIWDPNGRNEPVVVPMQAEHFTAGRLGSNHISVAISRVNGLDMIVATDNDAMYLLSRHGNTEATMEWPGEKRLCIGQLGELDVIVIVNGRRVRILQPPRGSELELDSEDIKRPDGIAICRLDGQYIIVTAEGDSLQIFDPETGTRLGNIDSHHHRVWGITIAQIDGRDAIISIGADSVLRIWETFGRSIIGTEWIGHIGPIDAVAAGFLGGKIGIVTGHRDGTALLWREREH